MSIEDLRAGLKDLVEGLEKRRKNKREAEQVAAEKQARLDLSNQIGASIPGQTSQGSLVNTAFRSGLLEPKQALDALSSLDRYKIYFGLQEKVMQTTDPTQKAELMQVLKKLTTSMNEINQAEAYYKSMGVAYGNLQARKDFGVLYKNRGGRGGGGKSGEQELTENPTTKTMSIPLPLLPTDFSTFLKGDKVGKIIEPNKAVLGQGLSEKQMSEFRENALDFLTNYNIQNGNLNRVGDGKRKARAKALEQLQLFERQGISSFEGTFSSEGMKKYQPYAIDVELDDDDLYNYSQNLKTGNVVVQKKKNKIPKVFVKPDLRVDIPPPQPKKQGILDRIFGGGEESKPPQLVNPQDQNKNQEDFRNQMLK